MDLNDCPGKTMKFRDLTVLDDAGTPTVIKYLASEDATAGAGGGGGTPVWL